MNEIIGILVYLIFQLLIGIWVSKRISSEQDYFLGGRSLGLGLATFSIFATWFGAETCIGSAAAIFKEGLAGGRADPFGYSICLVLLALFLAYQIRQKNYTTLADLYRERYSPWVEKVAVCIMVPSSLIWAAAQVRAFGQVLSVVTPFSVDVAVTVAASLVILYTYFGGLLGDVMTDLVQGIFLMIGLFILLVTVVGDLGGVTKIPALIDPSKLNFSHPDESFWSRLDSWMVPILGSLVTQELISKVLACKTPQVARKASYVAALLYLVVGMIPVFLGLLGPHLSVTLDDQEQFLPILAKNYLPPLLFILFSGAMISAILSTVDSTLLTISALLTHNLILPLRPNVPERKKVLVARMLVFITGIVAYFLAIHAEGVYDLVETASAFGTSGIFVITIFGLWSRFGGPVAATSALIVGLVLTPCAEYWWEWPAPFMTSVMASLGTYIMAELAHRKVVPYLRMKGVLRPLGEAQVD